jgi:hypothetical protein
MKVYFLMNRPACHAIYAIARKSKGTSISFNPKKNILTPEEKRLIAMTTANVNTNKEQKIYEILWIRLGINHSFLPQTYTGDNFEQVKKPYQKGQCFRLLSI